ncbi:helix-turn-helix transcriptional regulator [Lachnospiraceae bacterium 62-26]
MTYGDRLKFIRTFRQMTQKELGNACNFGKNGHLFIAQYENGTRTPKPDRNRCIAEALGVNPKVLMWDAEMPHEDIVFQLCWAYILPSSDYPLSLTDAVLEEIQVFMSEYNMALEGQLSETEYIEKKFGFMNGIEKYFGDQALSRF